MTIPINEALEDNNIAKLRKVKKGDLHNHAPRGGNISDIENWVGIKLNRLDQKFNDLNEMQSWYNENIRCYCQGKPGYDIRLRAAFLQAKRDGVSKLVLTFGLGEEELYGSLTGFSKAMNDMHMELAPEIEFIPELALGSNCDPESIYEICDHYFEQKFYKSIDINGIELESPYPFQKIYRLAKSRGLTLRAHIGEWGDAYNVKETVEALELNEVQHGNSAAESEEVMRFLSENNIKLNICPASNIILNRAKDYKTHPIRNLFDEGIKVTINTDDMLIFNVGISEMLLRFYNDGVFTANELAVICRNSLE